MLRSDICIAGAGIIGLSLALELQTRGLSVIVVEAGTPLREASFAAAGMLAAHDPHNPVELKALAELSIDLYPGFLDRLRTLGGTAVPFQTSRTLQSSAGTRLIAGRDLLMGISDSEPPPPFDLLDEHSLDPRQLASSVHAAVLASPVRLIADCRVTSTRSQASCVLINTAQDAVEAANFIDCTGAWANDPAFKVIPIKGQMLALELPADFLLAITVRTRDIYIVPRTTGPSAGRAIIGATVEDVGFDKQVHSAQLRSLHQQAAAIIPQLAHAKVLDSWAGLRPATPDRLPLIGAHPTRPNHWVATGHYRNGILLAPATAHVMTQLLLGENPDVRLDAFSPLRSYHL